MNLDLFWLTISMYIDSKVMDDSAVRLADTATCAYDHLFIKFVRSRMLFIHKICSFD